MKKLRIILCICLLSLTAKADFISVKRGIASEGTESQGSPDWMSQEELGYDNTNSGAMMVTVTNLLNQMLSESSKTAENITSGNLEISVVKKGNMIEMTARLTSPDATTVEISCYKTDSGKFSCNRNVGDGADPKAKALFMVISELDSHIEMNSRWRQRLQNNGGSLNIHVQQTARTSFGSGYRTEYNVSIGGQASRFFCESSYDGDSKTPAYDDAGCHHNGN